MLNGYSGIRTRNFGLCLPSLLVGQTMIRQSEQDFWTLAPDEYPDPQLDLLRYLLSIQTYFDRPLKFYVQKYLTHALK